MAHDVIGLIHPMDAYHIHSNDIRGRKIESMKAFYPSNYYDGWYQAYVKYEGFSGEIFFIGFRPRRMKG